jgi:branched-chain amino acid transport system permease protein
LFVFGSAVVLLMIWLPDGLLSLPDRIRARRQSRLESEARRLNTQVTQPAQQGGAV